MTSAPDKSRPVNSYKSAKARLGDKERVKLDRNTYLERRDDKTIVVILHATDIVTFTPTYTMLDSGGWHTVTTKGRMEHYIPGSLISWGKGWAWCPLAELPCYCVADKLEGDGLVVIGEHKPGLRPEWTEEYQYPDGSRDVLRETGGKPVYKYVTCQVCKGTGQRMGADFESGGHPYFDGIRLHPSGTRLMVKQPRAPKQFDPVRTVSGWTGQPLARFGGRR